MGTNAGGSRVKNAGYGIRDAGSAPNAGSAPAAAGHGCA